MNSTQPWVYEQEVAVNKKLPWVLMGFKKKKMNKKKMGYETVTVGKNEEDEQKQYWVYERVYENSSCVFKGI